MLCQSQTSPFSPQTETISRPDGSVMMMQIDCEVTATRLVHIQKSDVPENIDLNITDHSYHHTPQHTYYKGSDDFVEQKRKQKQT